VALGSTSLRSCVTVPLICAPAREASSSNSNDDRRRETRTVPVKRGAKIVCATGLRLGEMMINLLPTNVYSNFGAMQKDFQQYSASWTPSKYAGN